MLNTLKVFDQQPWTIPACFDSWSTVVKIKTIMAKRESVAAKARMLDLHKQEQVRHAGAIYGLMLETSTYATLKSIMVLWKRLHHECVVDKTALSVQHRWKQREQSTDVQLHSLNNRCSALLKLVHGRVSVDFEAVTFQLVLLAWQQTSQREKVDRELTTWEEAACVVLQTQQHFEEASREQWADHCLFLKCKEQIARKLSACLNSWLWAVKSQRQQRHDEKLVRRSTGVAKIADATWACDLKQWTFCHWQGAAYITKRHYLEARSRYLKEALAAKLAKLNSSRKMVNPVAEHVLPNPAVAATSLSLDGTQSEVGQTATDYARPLPMHTASRLSPAWIAPCQVNMEHEDVRSAQAPTDAGFAERLRAFTFGISASA